METKSLRRNLIRNAVITGIILLIPLIGRWHWTLSDFVIMGILIFGIGLAYELIVRKVTAKKHRVLLTVIFFGIFLLLWGELAVDLFGSPIAGN